MTMSFGDIQYLDCHAEVDIVERKLPHWSQPGAIAFITFRTHDSLPHAVVQDWLAERRQWLHEHGIDGEDPHWRSLLEGLPRSDVLQFERTFSDRWHDSLDACHGRCVLREPRCAKIVVASLRHFHSVRYYLVDCIVMPNHVHLLVAFANNVALLAQCESWKRFTAKEINREINSTGRFWQQDCFDHIVRSESQFEWLRRYIAENPLRAKLKQGEYLHWSHDAAAPIS